MEQKIIHTYWQNKVFIIKREIPSFVISVTSKISRFNLKDDKFTHLIIKTAYFGLYDKNASSKTLENTDF